MLIRKKRPRVSERRSDNWNSWRRLSYVVVLLTGCDTAAPSAHKAIPAASDAKAVEAAKSPRATSGGRHEAKAKAGNWPDSILDGKLIDLTHAFDENTIYWPTEQGFRFEKGNNGVTPKGFYYAANRFATAEHGGTHLDAPIHFAADHHTAEQVELERFMGEAVVIDVANPCAKNPDYLIGVAELHAWEQQHKRQLDRVIVLLRTGWSSRWPDRLKYLGIDAHGPEAVALLHFPGLAPEAARWLVEHRNVKAIGIDTASIDYGQSSLFESHVILCGHNVPIFENVTNLDRLPAERSLVIALPMKIAGGSGGPLRIVAIVRK